MIKNAKEEFYAQKVQECKGDQNKLYKVTDCLMGREKPKTLPTASSSLLAETFNDFFLPKIRIIREQLTSLEPTVVEMLIQTLDSLLRTCSVIMDTYILAPASVKEVTDNHQRIIQSYMHAGLWIPCQHHSYRRFCHISHPTSPRLSIWLFQL